MSEISVQCKYMLRVNIRTPLKVIFGTKNIIGGVFSLSTQYVSQLLTVLNRKLNKTVILTCRCSMCIENESTGKYTCSRAPYTRFTSVKRDDFNFHITNFPFLSNNIPSLPAYCVFISQLIRYVRASSSYERFILRAV